MTTRDTVAPAAVLRNCAFFSCFSSDEVKALSKMVNEQELVPGEFLFRRGEVPDRLYVLGSGVVKSLVYSSSGKALTLSLYSPNDIVGEAAFLTGNPYASSCVAVTPARLLVIPRREFQPFMPAHPEMPIKAIDILVNRILLLQSRLENIAGASTEQRLVNILLYLRTKLGNPLPLTKCAIAEVAGLTTETVIRIMSCLEKRGLISSGRGWVTILDAEALEGLFGD